MNSKRKRATTALVMVMAIALMSTQVLAGITAPSKPTTDPPQGLAIQGDAGKAKINAVISAHFYNMRVVDGQEFWDASIVVRVREANDSKYLMDQETYYREVVDLPRSYQGAVQETIIDSFEAELLSDFGYAATDNLVLRSIEEYGDVLDPFGEVHSIINVVFGISVD